MGWDARNINGIEHWEDRLSNCFTDAMLAFEADEDLAAEDIPGDRKFPFMMALASARSAMLKSMVSVTARMGAQRDRVIFIPCRITIDPRVMHCMAFYMYTGLVADVHALTRGGTLSICSVLTHEAVVNPEFSFDLLVLD